MKPRLINVDDIFVLDLDKIIKIDAIKADFPKISFSIHTVDEKELNLDFYLSNEDIDKAKRNSSLGYMATPTDSQEFKIAIQTIADMRLSLIRHWKGDENEILKISRLI